MPVGYLRFFLTILPALVACGMWLIGHATQPSSRRTARIAGLVTAALVTLISSAAKLPTLIQQMERMQSTFLTVQQTCAPVIENVPPDGVIFTRMRSQSLHLQFVRPYKLYDLNLFRITTIEKLRNRADDDDVQPSDPGRALSISERLKGVDQAGLDRALRRALLDNLHAGRRVFIWEGLVALGANPQPAAVVTARRQAGNSTESLSTKLVVAWRPASDARSWVLYEVTASSTGQ
jgi:hypothetical protein